MKRATEYQPSAPRTAFIFAGDPTDKSVGYFHPVRGADESPEHPLDEEGNWYFRESQV